MHLILEQEFKKALNGKEIWNVYNEKYHLNEDGLVIIMPTVDEELNKTAVQLLPEYMERKYYKNALVLSRKKYISKHTGGQRVINECLSNEEMTCIVSYYRLKQFFKNIVIVSIEEPFGGGGIIGKENISLYNYIRDALYV